MSNHKWKDNVCVNCGIKRERKEYRRWQRSETYLSRAGVWEDRTIYTYGTAWYYGEKYRFERPQCELVKLKII